MASGTRLIILDRDGVLNQTLHNPLEARPDSPLRVEDVRIFPWVPGALRQLSEAGFVLAIATNQPAFAKGKASLEALQQVQDCVLREVQRDGGIVSSVHVCFHRAEDGCDCRKPKAGLLNAALQRHPGVSRVQSWMVGDRATDVLAGAAAGLQTALLADTLGLERQALAREGAVEPSFCGDDLQDFVRFILAAAAHHKY